MKKLMLLGGIRYLLPVIKTAHELGCYVITADYLPDNIAHKFSDEYVNVSIVNKEAVLKVAREKKIDGIMSFGVDPGVVTAAYVAEMMGLPFQCSYESACILQDKSQFRQHLSNHGFNCPKAKGYDDIDEALRDADAFSWPVIVKPVDSAGSKGVTEVFRKEDLRRAVETAFAVSISKNFIIEDFLVAEGQSSGSESFFVNGELRYNAFYDQLFELNSPNPFVPMVEQWPSMKDGTVLDDVRRQLQRLGAIMGFGTGLFNVEWRVSGGKVYLMEVSPRAGGNRLAEILNYATDVDIIMAETLKSVGMEYGNVHEPNYNGNYAIYNLHSNRLGRFARLAIDPAFEKRYLIEKEIRVEVGNPVEPFAGANTSIGTLFLRTDTRQELDDILKNIDKYINIVLE
ncbi:MAG: ATP-grasp domain-containing protein [Bacteroidales bacterium]|nr:ATP-grasp domain-containing protein [Bacteroidales bacterium]